MNRTAGPTLALAGISNAEQRRARRVRRMNFRIYLLIWMAFFSYAVLVLASESSLAMALDRFLPLQLVAGLAALVVFYCGQTFGRRSILRKIAGIPAAFTAVGVVVSLMFVLTLDDPYAGQDHPAFATEVDNPPVAFLVSL